MENQVNILSSFSHFRNMMKRNNSFSNEFSLLKKTLETLTMSSINNSINFLHDEKDISNSLKDKIQKLNIFKR